MADSPAANRNGTKTNPKTIGGMIRYLQSRVRKKTMGIINAPLSLMSSVRPMATLALQCF